jgi:hypothetical protein
LFTEEGDVRTKSKMLAFRAEPGFTTLKCSEHSFKGAITNFTVRDLKLVELLKPSSYTVLKALALRLNFAVKSLFKNQH